MHKKHYRTTLGTIKLEWVFLILQKENIYYVYIILKMKIH